MRIHHMGRIVCVIALSLLLGVSCAKKEKKAEQAPADTAKTGQQLTYVSQEIVFSVAFDEKGTQRTLKLGARDKEIKIYIMLDFPEAMQISAVEYRLVLPPGLVLEGDKFYEERSATLGTFEEGLSEAFPCVAGPRIVLHALTLRVTGEFKNAEISLMPSETSTFIGVATCDEGNPTFPASSFKAVINPEE